MSLPWAGEQPPLMLQRPRCGYCSKRLRPIIHTNYRQLVTPKVSVTDAPVGSMRHDWITSVRQDLTQEAVSREWLGYDAYGSFCTLRCCEAFANAAYKAGYRIKGQS